MSKKRESTTVGKIPDDIWNHQKWFIGKLQLPLGGGNDLALIYDETRKWEIFIPVEWCKDLKLRKGQVKAYFWMWYDENHAINVESEVKDEQYW